VLGLLGLGLVVLVHELGHLAAALAAGVEVEAFSIGWGPKLAGFTRGGIEWRISVLPIGGYCKMRGEEDFRKALEEKAPALARDERSFYGTSPWRRILIALAGPAANVFFALIVFIVVAAAGYTIRTTPNRIVLASEYSLDGTPRGSSFPADQAGLRTGDRIVSAEGRPIADYSDIQELAAVNADKPLALEVERNGERLSLTVTPLMDRETGAGRIGVYSWIDPVVESLEPGGAAAIAGIGPGDRILSADGKPIEHGIAFLELLSSRPERLRLLIDRGGERFEAPLVLSWAEDGSSNLGLGFATQAKIIRSASLAAAVGDGFTETWDTFALSARGLGLLFRGVDLFKAVSGPARITYMVGKSAEAGMQAASSGGIAQTFNFLAFLSIALFLMNLLPIPALDGGVVLVALLELARRRPLKPLTMYRYQFVGAAMILAIFVFATIGDLLFFAAR